MRLAGQGQRLERDTDCQVQISQPSTWGGLMARVRRQGRSMFLRRRLGARLGAESDRPAAQAGLLVWLLVPASDRAWSLAAIAWLLPYPLNRAFLNFVANAQPQVMGKALLY